MGSLIALMVAEGEDWKSVEVPTASGSNSTSTSSAPEETEESEQPSGGNSNYITFYMYLNQTFYM